MANQDNVEIEIKIKVSKEEFKQLKEKFDKEANFIKEVQQEDEYFTTEFKDFTKEQYPYEWLSIRKRGGKNILNYKHFYPEGAEKTDYCDEYEVNVDSTENLKNIFSE